MQGENLEEKKKERKREIRKHSSLKHFSAVSCTGSLALSLLFCLPISSWLSPPLVWTAFCLSSSVSTDLLYLLSLLTPLSLSLPLFPALSHSPSLFLFISLLSYSLSPYLYFSISLPAYSTTCLSFSNSPFISLSSVWLSISMSVSPFSSTGIKKSCDTSGLASVYWLFHSVTSRSSWFFICWGIVDCVMHISIQCYGSR